MENSSEQAPAEMPQSLRRFQDSFAAELLEPGVAGSQGSTIAALVRQPAFAVYRNTVIKGCIDALQANYPSVMRLVGEEWFRAAAAIYVRAHPPSDPSLLKYGESFAKFLAGFEPAAELPYLPGVAQLDRLWTEAHVARDELPATAPALAVMGDVPLIQVVLRPHASARWRWFATHPIFTIWQRNRATGTVDESEIDWRGEGALLSRPRDAVQWTGLDAAGCAFLDACATGGTVADAWSAALGIDPDANVATLLVRILDAGALSLPLPLYRE